VNGGFPADEPFPVGRFPKYGNERSNEELLREAHSRVRRHLERPKLHEALPPRRAIGAVELVDAQLGAARMYRPVNQQSPEEPVVEPRRRRLALRRLVEPSECTSRRGCRFALVDSWRFACRADEQPRKEVRERRMIEPVADEALKQVRPPEYRAVLRRRPTQDDVVAAAGARVAAVEHELLGAQADVPGLVVEDARIGDELSPVARRVQVHFDDPRIRRDAQSLEARIGSRRVPLEPHLLAERSRRELDGGAELQVVFQKSDGWHEDVQHAVARLQAKSGAHGGVALGARRREPGRGRPFSREPWRGSASRVANGSRSCCFPESSARPKAARRAADGVHIGRVAGEGRAAPTESTIGRCATTIQHRTTRAPVEARSRRPGRACARIRVRGAPARSGRRASRRRDRRRRAAAARARGGTRRPRSRAAQTQARHRASSRARGRKTGRPRRCRPPSRRSRSAKGRSRSARRPYGK
jgi:hypothetical protein